MRYAKLKVHLKLSISRLRKRNYLHGNLIGIRKVLVMRASLKERNIESSVLSSPSGTVLSCSSTSLSTTIPYIDGDESAKCRRIHSARLFRTNQWSEAGILTGLNPLSLNGGGK